MRPEWGGYPFPSRAFWTNAIILALRKDRDDGEPRMAAPWDSLHGEVEAFSIRGGHVAVLDAVTGLPKPNKSAVRGRRIDV